MSAKNHSIKVAFWVRCLAIIYLACVTFIVCSALYQLSVDSTVFLQKHPIRIGEYLMHSYIALLFGYVAITGLNPIRFFPFASLSWPLFSASSRSLLRELKIEQPKDK